MTALVDACPDASPRHTLELMEGLDAPCRHHREEVMIGDAVVAWAAARGLMPHAKARAARFEGLASRAFSESTTDRAILFGRWLAWLCAYDDARDIGDGPHPAVLATAFRELWLATAPHASPNWRRRFADELRRHQQTNHIEEANRHGRRTPTISEYEQLRRATNGSYMFLLPEALLRAEVPQSVVETNAWQTLFQASDDLVAWCNDIFSLHQDLAAGNTTNYVLVIQHELGVPQQTPCSRYATG